VEEGDRLGLEGMAFLHYIEEQEKIRTEQLALYYRQREEQRRQMKEDRRRRREEERRRKTEQAAGGKRVPSSGLALESSGKLTNSRG